MTTKTICTAVASLLLAAATARADGPATRPATGPAVTPSTRPAVAHFELMPSGHIAVMAAVNGRGPYRFVLDTGAPMTLINEKVAKASGILPKKFRKPFFSPLGNLGTHKVDSIDLGGGRLEKLVADVWNHPTVDLLAESEGPLEGIIGFPFFSRFHAVIDYKAKTITMEPSAFVPVDTREKLQATLESGEQPTIAPTLSLGVQLTKGDATTPGVTVTGVSPQGPAAAAGVRPGDRLLTLDGRWTDAVADVFAAAAAVDGGTASVPLTALRNGTVVTLAVAVRPGI